MPTTEMSMSGPGGSHRLSLVLGGYALFFGLCLLFWAFFLSRISRLRLMLISVVGIYLACIALAGINHRDPGNDAILLLWVPILLIGIFAETSFAPAALAYLADISEEAIKDRGLVMGLYSIFLGLGQILGNGLGGLFTHRFGFDGLIYLTVLLATVALLSLLWLFKQDGRSRWSRVVDDIFTEWTRSEDRAVLLVGRSQHDSRFVRVILRLSNLVRCCSSSSKRPFMCSETSPYRAPQSISTATLRHILAMIVKVGGTETYPALRQEGRSFFLPKRKYREGTMNRLITVEVTSPPRITIAIGCSIS